MTKRQAEIKTLRTIITDGQYSPITRLRAAEAALDAMELGVSGTVLTHEDARALRAVADVLHFAGTHGACEALVRDILRDATTLPPAATSQGALGCSVHGPDADIREDPHGVYCATCVAEANADDFASRRYALASPDDQTPEIVTFATLAEANADDTSALATLRDLPIGARVTFGGGAAPLTVIERLPNAVTR